jgi:hypothetical protein
VASVDSPDKTVEFVVLHGGWRVLLSSAVITAPLFAWIIFYYLATGAWDQSIDTVRSGAPLLATFVLPLVIGGWILGFRRWYLASSVVLTVAIAIALPSPTLANQLFPHSYINLAIVLILLMIGLRAFHYWREYLFLELPIAPYTMGACVTVAITTATLLTLLTAISI